MGAKINAAAAELGAGGGTVIIPNGGWTFTTPIVLDGKRSIVLRGVGSAGGSPAASNLSYAGAGDAWLIQGNTFEQLSDGSAGAYGQIPAWRLKPHPSCQIGAAMPERVTFGSIGQELA